MTGYSTTRSSLPAKVMFLLIVAAMLVAPLFADLLRGPGVQTDNRKLADAPALPTNLQAMWQWPRRVDAYLNDHFGLRPLLVRIDTSIHWHLFHESPVASVVAGRHGRLFLADGDVPFRVLLGNCGAWWPDNFRSLFTTEASDAIRRLQSFIPGIAVLVVPTSAVLYPGDLPGWMARACAGRTPLVTDILNHLPEDIRASISYPLDIASGLPASSPLVPKQNFHWEGMGPHLFMQAFAERALHLKRQIEAAWVDQEVPSDLAVFMPGTELANFVAVPLLNENGIHYCSTDACLNRPPLDGADIPGETVRIFRSGAGGKLLLLSDSFGVGAAATLIDYVSDIIVININQVQGLPPAGRDALWRRLIQWQPDRVLVVIEDGNIGLLHRFATLLP